VHFLHALQFHLGGRGVLFHRRALEQLARDPRALDVHVRHGAARLRGLDELDHEGIGHIERIDQGALALFQLGGKTGQHFGQPGVTGIAHRATFETHPPSINLKADRCLTANGR